VVFNANNDITSAKETAIPVHISTKIHKDSHLKPKYYPVFLNGTAQFLIIRSWRFFLKTRGYQNSLYLFSKGSRNQDTGIHQEEKNGRMPLPNRKTIRQNEKYFFNIKEAIEQWQ
jgi:hypothetical protein